MEPSARHLKTDHLLLRPLVSEDEEHLWQLDQDPEVMRFISGGRPTSRETVRDVMLPRMLQVHPQGPEYGFWSAEDRATGRWVGWFHLRPERLEPFEMELGYRLRREFWGLGLATEGSRALIEIAFRDWGLDRVAARTLVGNRASRRVMEKLGLVLEREFVYPEDWLPWWNEQERRAVRYVSGDNSG
jgi:RimJ/RimL family protein N-acetyltransferase